MVVCWPKGNSVFENNSFCIVSSIEHTFIILKWRQNINSCLIFVTPVGHGKFLVFNHPCGFGLTYQTYANGTQIHCWLNTSKSTNRTDWHYEFLFKNCFSFLLWQISTVSIKILIPILGADESNILVKLVIFHWSLGRQRVTVSELFCCWLEPCRLLFHALLLCFWYHALCQCTCVHALTFAQSVLPSSKATSLLV